MNFRALLFSLLLLHSSVLCSAAAMAAGFECLIEPMQVVELKAPLEGQIEKVEVDRGDTVKQGQVLVVLDTAVVRSQSESRDGGTSRGGR